jgi:hypothetical protein
MILLIRKFFHVDGSKSEKRRVKWILIPVFTVIIGLFSAGYTVVYARSYNVLNDTHITAFNIEKQGNSYIVTYLGKQYKL